MEFITCKLFRNGQITDQHIWPGSSPVVNFSTKLILLVLVIVFATLIGAAGKKRKIHKPSDLFDIVFAKKSTGIPSVSTWTILKGLCLYGRDFRSIAELIFAKYGEVVNLNVLGLYKFTFITNSAMLWKLYMSTEPAHLRKPKLYRTVFVKNLKNGLVSSDPELWKIHRSVISKAFTYNGLLRQLNIFEEHAKRFVLSLQETHTTPLSKKVDFSFGEKVKKLTFEIISHITAGNDMDLISSEEKAKWLFNFEGLEEVAGYRFQYPWNLIDYVWKLNPKRLEVERKYDELSFYTNKVIANIRTQCDANTIDGINIDDDMAGKSFVDLMIKAGFSNEEIFTEVLSLFVAAIDTTSTTFKLLLLVLAKHKEYQDKCRTEIDHMFEQISISNNGQISMEALNSLTFLDMCIKECLRIFAVLPMGGRKLKSPLQLDKNICLPSETTVVLFSWMTHHNPKIYPDPDKFIPERFTTENAKIRKPFEYIPFSAGPRNCIGFKSAMIELKVLAAYVLHNFEVTSETSIVDLNQELRKKFWPFPDIDIKLHPRQ